MRVSTLITLKSFLFIAILTLAGSLVTPASTLAGEDWTRDLGRKDHIAYIALDQLDPNDSIGWSRGFTFNDFKPPLATFFEKFHWAPNDCWAGSVLKNGVKAYCLPYARLGKHYQSFHDPSVKIYNSISSCAGLYIWHVPQENSFYLWGICWNVSGVLGPFRGDPKIILPHALKRRKGQRSFPGATLTVVSQRWLYPNAHDARVSRDEHYDCAHGHLSGRTIEMMRLNTFITRLRLANRGATEIYYQTETDGGEKPAICALLTDHPEDWEQALKVDYQCDIAGVTWRRLGRGEAVEFEKTGQANTHGSAGFVLLLNEEANYWDPHKLLGTYPVMFGRK